MESWQNQKSKLKVSRFSNFQETTLTEKKMFKLALEKLVRKDANIQKPLLREIKKLHHKGQGKAWVAFHEIAPTDFSPDISDVNERNIMFFKQCNVKKS